MVLQIIIHDFRIIIFSGGLSVVLITQKSLDSLYHCQTSQIHVSRKLLFSSLQFFIVPKHCDVSSGLVLFSTDSRDGCEYTTPWRFLSFSDRKRILVLNTQAKHFHVPVSVAQLDAPSDWRPGGRVLNPAEVGNILSWRLIMKYFLRSFSRFR